MYFYTYQFQNLVVGTMVHFQDILLVLFQTIIESRKLE